MAPLLVLEHATKSFGSVQALEDGSVELQAGQAHALIGENGAGKSTLVKILAGVHRPDSGRLLLDGQELHLANPAAARDAGIAVIYQEPTLFPDLSVAENIFMGRQPLSGGRRIDRRRAAPPDRGADAAARRPPRPEPARPRPLHRRPADRRDRQGPVVRGPGGGHGRADRGPVRGRGRAAVQRGPDPPEHGAAVLFVSHRLDEVFALCQRVTIMRDGRHIVQRPARGPDQRRPGAPDGRPRAGRRCTPSSRRPAARSPCRSGA